MHKALGFIPAPYKPDVGGAWTLWSQHLGGEGRRISAKSSSTLYEFEASLGYLSYFLKNKGRGGRYFEHCMKRASGRRNVT